MSTLSKAEENLGRCVRALDVQDYYNGGQTVVARYPVGSEQRARIVAEATFWQAEVNRLTRPADIGLEK